MFAIEILTNQIPTQDFIETYCDPERFLKYCMQCPNYNNRWSCPPNAFDAMKLLSDYSCACVILMKVCYDPQTVARIKKDEIISFSAATFGAAKADLNEIILNMEAELPKARASGFGSCRLCEECNRPSGLPCRFPEKMRPALDAFSPDVTRLSGDLFENELKWPSETLPEYYSALCLMLTDTELHIEKSLNDSMKARGYNLV